DRLLSDSFGWYQRFYRKDDLFSTILWLFNRRAFRFSLYIKIHMANLLFSHVLKSLSNLEDTRYDKGIIGKIEGGN
ncbi:hypothetical protein, partial [Paenibacillus brasilensis]